MKSTKRLTCLLATLALAMCTYVPARAEFLGTLPKDQDWRIEITNSHPIPTTAVTIYYVDKRGLDVVATLSVTGGDPVQETLPKPGRNVRRVIMEIDAAPGYQTTLRINGGGAITIEQSLRLVFDVV